MEIRLIRAQEVSRYVGMGTLTAGSRVDWIKNGSDVHEVGEFVFSKVSRQPARWVLAVPESSLIKSRRIWLEKESPPRSFGSPGNTSGSTA